jgi:hypothetical protein
MPQRTGVQVQPGATRCATSDESSSRYAKGRVETVADQIGMGVREMQIDGDIPIGSKETRAQQGDPAGSPASPPPRTQATSPEPAILGATACLGGIRVLGPCPSLDHRPWRNSMLRRLKSSVRSRCGKCDVPWISTSLLFGSSFAYW